MKIFLFLALVMTTHIYCENAANIKQSPAEHASMEPSIVQVPEVAMPEKTMTEEKVEVVVTKEVRKEVPKQDQNKNVKDSEISSGTSKEEVLSIENEVVMTSHVKIEKSYQANEIITNVEPVTVKPLENEITTSDKEIEALSDAQQALAAIEDRYNELLTKYVSSSGVVDYSGLKKVESTLDSYLATLSSEAPAQTDKSQEALAYWINAYNAATIKLILKNWPVTSIIDLHGGKPWDVSWVKLGTNTYSLNNIEHDIIRKVFKDPRIHFAVNCAAKSCPKLNNTAMTAQNVNSELEKLTSSFINSSNNKISSSKLELSKIFEWYRGDFGELISFINKYSKTPVKSNAQISFLDYNWSLNGR